MDALKRIRRRSAIRNTVVLNVATGSDQAPDRRRARQLNVIWMRAKKSNTSDALPERPESFARRHSFPFSLILPTLESERAVVCRNARLDG